MRPSYQSTKPFNHRFIHSSRLRFHTSPPKQFLTRRNWKENRYRKYDQVPQSFSLIYRVTVDNYLRVCKHISTFSALAGLGLLGYRFFVDPEHPYNFDLKIGPLVSSKAELYVFTAAFVVFTLAIRVTMHRLPSRIYKDADKYIAVFHETIPFVKHRLHFTAGQVRQAPETGFLPWKDSRFYFNNRRCILIQECFKAPVELTTMMRSPAKQ